MPKVTAPPTPETDPEDSEIGPLRRCIATGERQPPERMIRLVVGPDGDVVPDLEGRLPGRGIWLSARRSVVNTACAKKMFAKAARAKVGVPADLADRIEGLLARRCQALLGLARRSGGLVAGHAKVKARLATGRPCLLIEAADGAPSGRARLRAMVPGAPVMALLSAVEIGAALGLEAVVHAVMDEGGLADRLIAEAGRLAGFRAAEATQAPERGGADKVNGVL